MASYKSLKGAFDLAVEELRQSCPHNIMSEWMDEWWGIGHSTGNVVRICEFCEKVVEKKGVKPVIKTKVSNDKVRNYTESIQFHDKFYGDERDNGEEVKDG